MADPSAPAQPGQISLYNNSLLSDVKIHQVFEGRVTEYHAHKAILSNHSQWFFMAFTGNFVVSCTLGIRSFGHWYLFDEKEAESREMEAHDDDPHLFEIMLKFFYAEEDGRQELLQQAMTTEEDGSSKLQLIKLYNLADKYDAASLRASAVAQYRKSVPDFRLYSQPAFEEIVKEYYEHCLRPGTDMGAAISATCRVILAMSMSPFGPAGFLNMVKKYPVLGADIWIADRMASAKAKEMAKEMKH